ncbi:BglG family transcription antiterminator [Lacticaseibacillus baoqingensis]|uniref:BglG family transcription antiterminator n=1 Tax=Lacticaseibacillus baoqingensis TaxID=2486013 RepID=A0ABW4E5H5_9LACO|nr:PTS sugar transporter subunit IIA [Lacticaseibacillus baoqingensis]
MKLDRKKEILSQIIQYLLGVSTTSFAEIAKSVGLSEKTARAYATEINVQLTKEHLGEIRRKRGVGVQIVADSSQRRAIKQRYLLESQRLGPDEFDTIEVTKNLLLLDKGEYVTKGRLAEIVFESVPTLSRTLERLNSWFQRFDLTIQAQPSKGITIVGSEFSRRNAIKAFIVACPKQDLNQVLQVFAPDVDIKSVTDTIREAENKWRIQFTDDSFRIISVMVCLCLARVTTPIKDMEQLLNKTEFYNEYNFSDTIFRLLADRGIITHDVDFNDIRLIALEIITANKIKWDHSPNVITQELKAQTAFDSTLKGFVKQIVQSVSSILNVDLTHDKQLLEGLTQHLRSAIFRMKYGRGERNVIDPEIKAKYKEVYLSVLAMSPLFEKHYNVQITETELNYIVLYIEAALLRKQQEVEAILVTNLGRAQRMLTVEMIKHYIPQINAVNIYSKKTFLEGEHSSSPLILTTENLPDRVGAISIHSIPDGVDLDLVKQRMSSIKLPAEHSSTFTKDSQSFFDANLIEVHVNADSKKTLLKQMVNKMVVLGKVRPKFFESVWSREQATTTSIGNMVALPHGDMDLVNEPCVSIATLAKPIQWFEDDDERVQTVIILATKMNNRFEINRTKHFFQDLIVFTENSSMQEHLLDMTDKSQVYNFLFS